MRGAWSLPGRPRGTGPSTSTTDATIRGRWRSRLGPGRRHEGESTGRGGYPLGSFRPRRFVIYIEQKRGLGPRPPRHRAVWHEACLSGLTCTYTSPRSRKVSSCHAPLRWGVHTGRIVRGQPSKDARPTASGARVSTNIVWRLLRQGPCHGYWLCNRLPGNRLPGPGPRVSAHLLLAHDVGRLQRCE